MRGLDPRIHALKVEFTQNLFLALFAIFVFCGWTKFCWTKDVDGRIKFGHDGGERERK